MRCSLKSWSCAAAFGSLLAFVGCQETASKPAAPVAGEQHAEGDGHAHPTEGPHHGHLIELGQEEYHAELTHEEATDKVTIYLLDSGAKESVPTASAQVTMNFVVDGKPQQFTLPAAPDVNDPAGKSSRFELADADLHEAIEAESAKGRLNVTIDGKDFVGSIEHEAHDEHEHHDD
jgi:hypothetical protein